MKLKGVFTAIITPFTENGKLDEAALTELIEFQIKKGISGLVPCGTTGESPTLTHQEHDRVIELTVKQTAGRVPVIAGTGSNSTAEAVRLSIHAMNAGADALLLVNPYYNKPTQKGLYLHFREIADSVSIPCVLYNIKGRTGVNLETETLVKLAEDCDNIRCVKEASGDINQIKEVISRKRKDFSVLSGDDSLTLDLIKAGGDGVISVSSNLVPDRIVAMVSAALSGDITEAEKRESELRELFKILFVETNPIPVKTAMAMAGQCSEVFRLPMCSLTNDEDREKIRDAITRLGVI